ncbi:hypothetical protein [Sediminibacter sp. Hel_I_10]|uniref:hypothetical protein n=1 Tax=Sediminibacter sp. Hel_I_10 TaxID=1392490 RepID=UPI00047AB830|nr:hypothetical protein [Sediminibacter sp. Hel_I_10]
MGKKILAYVFFLLGILCILSIIGNVISLIIGRKEPTYEIISAVLMAGTFAFVLFKYGLKWTSKKQTSEIDHIGHNS